MTFIAGVYALNRQGIMNYPPRLSIGKLNYADYWTKHHPAKHHQNICNKFLTPQVVEMLRQEQNYHTAKADEDGVKGGLQIKHEGLSRLMMNHHFATGSPR